MNFKKWTYCCLFTGLILIYSDFCRADTFFVKESVYIGEEKSKAQVFAELIKSYIASLDDHKVANKEESSDFILAPKVVEAGDSFIVFVDKKKGSNTVFGQMIKIDDFDEIDIATKRLVNAVIDEKDIKNSRKIGEVTKNEEEQPRTRVSTEGHWYLGFGPAFASGLNSKNTLLKYSFGYAWELDQNMIQIYIDAARGTNNDQSSLGGLGISLKHMFSRAGYSPLVNMDLLWGGATSNSKRVPEDQENFDSSATTDLYREGFILGVGAGYMLFRTSKINVETSLQVNSFLGKLPTGYPTSYGFRVGVYF